MHIYIDIIFIYIHDISAYFEVKYLSIYMQRHIADILTVIIFIPREKCSIEIIVCRKS